jgi:hypothetical protein
LSSNTSSGDAASSLEGSALVPIPNPRFPARNNSVTILRYFRIYFA